MRIISCHIDNFGKLSNYNFDFHDGLNIINQENGWGKTTFAAFLKAMFFGLDYSRSKKMLVDRSKYYPWNEGKFGGSITFEIKGKMYRIVRSFGKKESDDDFVIYDLDKNVETLEYSSNIGEEIWKVDRDSFEKTAFITLKEFDLLNDIISGKLGDIDEQEADMEASGKAISTLERNINRLDSKRSNGTGSIREKREELNALKVELDSCVEAGNEVATKERLIEEAQQESLRIAGLISQIEDMQIKRQLMARKKMLLDLKKECSDAVDRYQEINTFFNGTIPSENEIKDLETYVGDYNKANINAQEQALTPEEEQEMFALSQTFANTIPSSEELTSYADMVMQIAVLESKINHVGMAPQEEQRLIQLDSVYHPLVKKDVNIDQLINDYIGTSELEKRAAMYESELEKIQNQPEIERKNYIPFIIIYILITIGGVASLFAFESVIVGFAISIIGVAGLVSSIVGAIKESNKPSDYEILGIDNQDELGIKLDATIKTRDQLKSNYIEFFELLNLPMHDVMNTLLTVKAEVQEYKHLTVARDIANQNNKDVILELGEKQLAVDNFLGGFVDMNEVISRKKTLEGLTLVVGTYRKLLDKQQKYFDLCVLAKDWEKVAASKLANYFEQIPLDYNDAIEQIKLNVIRLKDRHQDVLKEKARYDVFAYENDVELLESIDLNMDISSEYQESLRVEKSKLVREKEEIIRVISGLKRDVEMLLIKADLVGDIESSVERVWEEISILEAQVDVMRLAKECMTNAKESLAEKYMGNITEAFDKYRKIIEEQELEQYHIDIGLNVKVEQEGMLHNADVLSKGKNDLMQVCMRLALVEAVYKDVESPTLILDDPFVNLDNRRLINATKLLEVLGEQQQLIYFVCHTSRII